MTISALDQARPDGLRPAEPVEAGGSDPSTSDPAPWGPVGLVGSVESAVRQLLGEDWTMVDRHDLVTTLVGVERVRSVLDAVCVDLVGRIHATRAGEAEGWATTGDLVTAVSGGGKGTGPGLVRLAQRLADLPATRAAMADGWLSRAKAAVVADRVFSLPHDPGLRDAAERVLLDAAGTGDAADLTRSWPKLVELIDPDGTKLGDDFSLERRERAAHAQRRLAFTPDRHGGVTWSGYSSVEDAELVKATLMPLAGPQPAEPGSCGGTPADQDPESTPAQRRGSCGEPVCAHDGRDRREGGARLLDALVTVCRQAQSRDGSDPDRLPADHGAAPRMLVSTWLDAIRAGLAQEQHGMPLWRSDYAAHQATPADRPPGAGCCAAGIRVGGIVNGLPLSVAAVRRLACDAEIIPAVLGSQGQVLDVGRAQRLVTPGQWHALVLRDGRCAFPGCGRLPVACDAHHVVHWVDGGPTNLDNLVMLCRRHHTLLHTTPWQVRINPADRHPEFRAPPGRRDHGWIRQRPPRHVLAC